MKEFLKYIKKNDVIDKVLEEMDNTNPIIDYSFNVIMNEEI